MAKTMADARTHSDGEDGGLRSKTMGGKTHRKKNKKMKKQQLRDLLSSVQTGDQTDLELGTAHPSINTPSQHPSNNTPDQHILSTPYQHTRPLNQPYQPTLSTHPINPPPHTPFYPPSNPSSNPPL